MNYLAITNLANTGQRTVQYSGEQILVGGLEGAAKLNGGMVGRWKTAEEIEVDITMEKKRVEGS
jgi:hypothetical protein